MEQVQTDVLSQPIRVQLSQNKEEYFNDTPEYISQSDLKLLDQHPSKLKKELTKRLDDKAYLKEVIINEETTVEEVEEEASDGMLIGSIVDTALTEGDEEVHERYYTLTTNKPENKLGEFCSYLVTSPSGQEFKEAYDYANIKGYKLETMLDKYKKEGGEAYVTDTRRAAQSGKQPIPLDLNSKALACINSFRESPVTSYLFSGVKGVDYFTQVAIFVTIDLPDISITPIKVKGMLDLIKVDYKKMLLYPVDFKVTKYEAYNWGSWGIVKYRYDLQQSMYYLLLELALRNPKAKDLFTPDFDPTGFDIGKFKFAVESHSTPGSPVFHSVDCPATHYEIRGLDPPQFILKGSMCPEKLHLSSGRSINSLYNLMCRYAWHRDKNLWKYTKEEYNNNYCRHHTEIFSNLTTL